MRPCAPPWRLLAGLAVGRRAHEADREVHLHRLARHPERLLHFGQRGLRGGQTVHAVGIARNHGELVLAHAPERGRGCDRRAQPRRHRRDQRVGRLLAGRFAHLPVCVESDEAEADDLIGCARAERRIEEIQHLAPIGQDGDRVLIGDLVRLRFARREAARGPADLADRQHGKADETGREHRQEGAEPDQHVGHRIFALPAQPSDDASLRVVERMQLAIALRGVDVEGERGNPGHGAEDAERAIESRHADDGRGPPGARTRRR